MVQNFALDDLIAALPMPALAIDTDERIVAQNPKAERLLGASFVSQHFVSALRQPGLVDAVERAITTKAPQHTQLTAGEAQINATYDVTVRQIAPSDLLLVSFQDVTQMAQAEQMRRDFVANVSHELRTPLTSLLGFIETLNGPAKDDTEARARFLGIMQSEAERMNRLVGDLLSLSRVEADERVRPKDKPDLRHVLATAVRNLTPLATEQNVALGLGAGTDPLLVQGDSDQLLQVFTNLIENAIKYGAAGKAVDIKVERHQNDRALRLPVVHVSVCDYGPGIEGPHLPRLTERFYRADSHRSRALGGTGLGLAIVKHIVNRHRGRLHIASEIGQGSTFSVILPLAG